MFPIALLLLVIVKSPVNAQHNVLSDKNTLIANLQQTHYPIDSNADAIVLRETGEVFLYRGKTITEVSKTIKLLNQKAVANLADIGIFISGDEYITKISGATYNYDNNGLNVVTIDKSDILKEKIYQAEKVYKFNLPNIREGSIITYSYTTESPGSIFIDDWYFQNEYPTLYSSYKFNAPSDIRYSSVQRSYEKFTTVQKEASLNDCVACFHEQMYSTNETSKTWVRTNLPAISTEVYSSSYKNFIESVNINITGDIVNNIIKPYFKNWDDFSKRYFFENKSLCGQVVDKNTFLQQKINEILHGKVNEIEKAKAIFSFVSDSVQLDRHSGQNIETVFNSRSGNSFGINLLLVAMMKKANLNCEPIMLATKSNGRLNPIYPSSSNINYIVGKVGIDTMEYFLDASIKQLPFGILHPNCYNGYSRIISKKGGHVDLSPETIANKSTVIATLKPADTENTGNMSLTVDQHLGIFSSIDLRTKLEHDTGYIRNKILETFAGSNPKITLKKVTVMNQPDRESRLRIIYEAAMNLSTNVNTWFINPYFVRFHDKNPFPNKERKYPIEMDYKEDLQYLLNFELPKGYQIDDLPAPISLVYGNNLATMKVVMEYKSKENKFLFKNRYTTNTTIFEQEEYNELRVFYSKVLEEQNKKITIKLNANSND